MIDYARSFMLLDDLDKADAVAEQVRKGLQQVRANQSMSQADISVHGHRLINLQRDLQRLREERR